MKNRLLNQKKRNNVRAIAGTNTLLGFVFSFLTVMAVAKDVGDGGEGEGTVCPAKITALSLETSPESLLCPGSTYSVLIQHNGVKGSGANDGQFGMGLTCGDVSLGLTSTDVVPLELVYGTNTYFAVGVLEGCPTPACADSLIITTNDVTNPTPDVATLELVSGTGSVSVPTDTNRPTATDDCPGPIYGETTPSDTTFTVVGIHTVTWTYTDASGNSVSQTQEFEVVDGVVSNNYSVSDTICPGESVAFGGQNLTNSGVYVDTIAVTGGDSIVELTLFVHEELGELSITEISGFGTFLALDSAIVDGLQWLDCDDDYAPIAGQTVYAYSDPEPGNYAVRIENVCVVDTTECYDYIGSSIEEFEKGSFQISPNPVVDRFELKFKDAKPGNKIEVCIYSGLGEKVIERQVVVNGQTYLMDVHNLESGVYYLEVLDKVAGAKISRLFIKE